MSQFYGTLDNGTHKVRTMRGFKTHGIRAEVKTHEFEVKVVAYHDDYGKNVFEITLNQISGSEDDIRVLLS